MTVANPPTQIHRPIFRRLASYWPFKLFVGGIISIGFFAGYFLLQKFPIFHVTQMPVTALDRLVGFHPDAAPLYLSLCFYIPIAPWLADSKRELLAYSSVVTAMCVAGLVIFLVWPTAISRPAVDASQPLIFRNMVSVDGLNNACPSLHAAFAVFSGFCIHRTLTQLGDRGWLRLTNWWWCVGILYATLATKQHVVVDLLGGGAMALLAWGAFGWLRDGRQEASI